MEFFLLILVGDFKLFFWNMYKHSPESKLDLEKVYLILFLIRMAMLEKPVKMRKIDERFQAIIMKPRNIKT